MKTILFALVLSFIFTGVSIPQTHEDAVEYLKSGIKSVDKGDYEDGVNQIKKALEIEPKNTLFNYELAFTYYKMNKYDKVINILEKVKKNPDTFDLIFSVLGNAYDIIGDRDKAIETYKTGLKKFPGSGKIYLELGVVEISEKKYEEALKYFEKGIEVEPTHPSNYYWASQIHAGSKYPLWGLIYGEIFLNLEQGTKRAEGISEMLFKLYSESISMRDSSGKKTINIKLNRVNDGKGFESDYEMTAMFAALKLAADSTVSGFNIDAMNKLRHYFIEMWYGTEKTKNDHNVLFDYHKMMIDKGLFEAYNYFILAYGDTDEFKKWAESNKEKAKEFDNWFSEYGINLTKENAMYRKENK